jgi:hypothetical protein
MPAAAAVPTSAGPLAFFATVDPSELTPDPNELTPDPSELTPDSTELPTDSITPLELFLLRLRVAVLRRFEPELDRDVPDRLELARDPDADALRRVEPELDRDVPDRLEVARDRGADARPFADWLVGRFLRGALPFELPAVPFRFGAVRFPDDLDRCDVLVCAMLNLFLSFPLRVPCRTFLNPPWVVGPYPQGAGLFVARVTRAGFQCA